MKIKYLAVMLHKVIPFFFSLDNTGSPEIKTLRSYSSKAGFHTGNSEVRSVAHIYSAAEIWQTEAAELLPSGIPALSRLLAFSSAFLESSTEKR